MAQFDLQVNAEVALPLLNQLKDAMKDVETCSVALKNAADACAANSGASDFAPQCAEVATELSGSLKKMCDLFESLDTRTRQQVAIDEEAKEEASKMMGRIKG